MFSAFARLSSVVAVCWFAVGSVNAANIFWASEEWDGFGILDQGFVDLLTNAGHTLDLRYGDADGVHGFLGTDVINEMNASDLVIVSRSLNSGNAQDPDGWNSVTAPMLSMNAYTSRVRPERWRWFDTNDLFANLDENLVATDPNHPIFNGISVVDMVDETIDLDDPGVVLMAITEDLVGNGTVLATSEDSGYIWAVYWEEGTEFFDGADQFAGGPRLFFAFGGEFPGAPGNNIGTPESDALFLSAVNFLLPSGDPRLEAGDADQNLEFNQLDLVKVQIAAKYLSGQAATWGEGDWNGAPGGRAGSPPAGNGFFDQLDIIAALASGKYLTGPYAAISRGGSRGDSQASVVYDPGTGEIAVDAPAGVELTSINIDSASGIFTGAAAASLGGSFDNDADNNIFKATFGGSFGSISFGNVAQAGLSAEMVADDLTVVGSLAGGGDLGNVDLVYVPEPSTWMLLGWVFLATFTYRARIRR